MEASTRRFNALVTRFDKPLKSEYGWASETATEQRNLSEIEAKISIEHWRPYYKLARHNVYANPKGILFKMGMPQSADLLLTGLASYGFADPGQSTALSLNHVWLRLGQSPPRSTQS
jgi:hypothetical protein